MTKETSPIFLPKGMSLGIIDYKQKYEISFCYIAVYQGHLPPKQEGANTFRQAVLELGEFFWPKQWGPYVLASRCGSHLSKCPVGDLDSLVVLHSILCLEAAMIASHPPFQTMKTELSFLPTALPPPLGEVRVEPKNWSKNVAEVTGKLLWNSWFLAPCPKDRLITETLTEFVRKQLQLHQSPQHWPKDIVKVTLQKRTKVKQQMPVPKVLLLVPTQKNSSAATLS